MTSQTFSIPMDEHTAKRLEALAKEDDRSPGRVIAAALRLYVRLSLEAQAAYRLVEAHGSDDSLDALIAELNRVILQTADKVPRPAMLAQERQDDAKRAHVSTDVVTSPHQPPPKSSAHEEARAVLTIKDFCRCYGLSRTTAYAELKEGRLRAKKIGRRTVILHSEAERWLASLQDR